jgi:hypothetical protein
MSLKHFKDLSQMVGKEGIKSAWEYDKLIASQRNSIPLKIGRSIKNVAIERYNIGCKPDYKIKFLENQKVKKKKTLNMILGLPLLICAEQVGFLYRVIEKSMDYLIPQESK